MGGEVFRSLGYFRILVVWTPSNPRSNPGRCALSAAIIASVCAPSGVSIGGETYRPNRLRISRAPSIPRRPARAGCAEILAGISGNNLCKNGAQTKKTNYCNRSARPPPRQPHTIDRQIQDLCPQKRTRVGLAGVPNPQHLRGRPEEPGSPDHVGLGCQGQDDGPDDAQDARRPADRLVAAYRPHFRGNPTFPCTTGKPACRIRRSAMDW